jgi:hypothetical protein
MTVQLMVFSRVFTIQGMCTEHNLLAQSVEDVCIIALDLMYPPSMANIFNNLMYCYPQQPLLFQFLTVAWGRAEGLKTLII